MKRFGKDFHKLVSCKDRLSYKVLSSVLALGTFVVPITGEAAIKAINKGVGAGSNLDAFNAGKTNVAKVYPGQIVEREKGGNVGVNAFKNFDVNKNQVANIYFHDVDKKTSVSTVMNAVDSRINISGVVNAIKDSKIGGNLYFISKDGMLVGSTGVINAGSLTVTAPKNNFFEDITGLSESGALEFAAGSGDPAYAWTTGLKNIDEDTIALNKTANVTILGNINTVDGVHIRAPFIYIGGEARDAQGKVYDAGTVNADSGNARIRSGVDFSKLVNIENLYASDINKIITDDTPLTAKEANGDILLTAYSDVVNYRDKDFTFLGLNGRLNNETRAEIIVTADSQIKGIGKTEIKAKSVNAQGDNGFAGFDPYDWNAATLFGGKVAKTVAKVDVEGSVQGNSVAVEAESQTKYISTNLTEVAPQVKEFFNFTGVGSLLDEKLIKFPAYSNLKSLFEAINFDLSLLENTAEVNIGKTAELKALGTAKNSMKIGAKSTMLAGSSMRVQNSAYPENEAVDNANNKPSDLVNAIADIGIVKNEAQVAVDGKLTSEGDIKISSEGNLKYAEKIILLRPAKPKEGEKSQSAYVNLAVGVYDADANSKVNINGSVAAKKDVSLTTENTVDLGTDIAIATDQTAFLATALNITDTDTSAQLAVDGAVTGANISLNALEELQGYEVSVDNNFNKEMNEFYKVYYDKVGHWAKDINNDQLIKSIQKALAKKANAGAHDNINNGGENVDIDASWTDKVDLGSTMAWNTLDNAAVVKLGKKASLIATENISVDAQSLIDDSRIKSAVSVNSGSSKERPQDFEANALVGLAFAYNEVNNHADLVLEGGDDKLEGGNSHVVLTGKNIKLNALSADRWDRVHSLRTPFEEWEEYAKKFKDDALIKDAQAIEALFEEMFSTEEDSFEKRQKSNERAQLIAGQLNKFILQYGQYKTLVNRTAGLVEALLDFTDPASYVQFFVSSATKANGENISDFALSGSLGFNMRSNNAKLIVGTNSQLTAKEKVELGADVDQTVTALYGETGNILDAATLAKGIKGGNQTVDAVIVGQSGTKRGVGGTVGINNNDLLSTVAVASGAQITASSINAAAHNNALAVGMYYSGANTTKWSLNGIGSYQYGSSNSIVAIDDNAKLQAVNVDSGKLYVEDKEDTPTLPGSISLNSTNDSTIVSVVGNLVMTDSIGIGASVGRENLAINSIAGIMDIDKGSVRSAEEEVNNLQNLLTLGLGTDYSESNFGKTQLEGSIDASNLSIDAVNDSVVQNFNVAGTVTKNKQEGDHNNEMLINDSMSSMSVVDLGELIGDDDEYYALDEVDNSLKLNAALAGSVSMNQLTGSTAALLEATNVNIVNPADYDIYLLSDEDTKLRTESTGDVSLQAIDSSFLGAWGGAMAVTNVKSDNTKAEATLSGVYALNSVKKSTVSQIKDAEVHGALSVKNLAQNEGAVVAAGVSIGLELGGRDHIDTKGLDLTLSGSVNLVDSAVHANIVNSDVDAGKNGSSAGTSLQNIAYDKDVQVAGGVDVDYAKTSVAIGAGVAYNKINNDIQALIKQSNLVQNAQLGKLENYALSNLTQVGSTVSVGVVQNQNDSSYFSLNGAVSLNNIDNKVNANIVGGTIIAKSLQVEALDSKLDGDDKKNTYIEALSNRGIDAEGAKLLQMLDDTEMITGVDTEELEADAGKAYDDAQKLITKNESTDETKDVKYETSQMKLGKATDSRMLGISVGVDKTTGDKITVSGAVAKNKFNNAYGALVQDATVITDPADQGFVQVKANSDSLMVGGAAGIALASKGTEKGWVNAAGSVVIGTITNTTMAQVVNSDLITDKVDILADTTSKGISIAGNFSGTSDYAGIGLSGAGQGFDNTTQASLLGSHVASLYKDTDANLNPTDKEVYVKANNDSTFVAGTVGVAAEMSSSSYLNVSGNVAVNSGKNNTIAEVDEYQQGNIHRKSSIVSAKNVEVYAHDDTDQIAVAAAGSGGHGYANGGAAVAVNEIKDQTLKAALNNTTIVGQGAGNVQVHTDDNTDLTAVAVGVDVNISTEHISGVVEGTSADNKVENKTNTVEMQHSTITGDNTMVKAEAKEDTTIVSTADTVSVSLGGGKAGFNAGCAIAVNDINSTTKVLADGNTLDVAEAIFNAAQDDSIYNVALGVEFSTTNVGINGSIGVNKIKADVLTDVRNSTLLAEGNVGALTSSTSKIFNFTGGLNVLFPNDFGGVGVGASVVYNKLDGDVQAKVSNSTVEAKGAGTKSLTSHTYTTAADTNAVSEEDLPSKGFVVDAYSKRDLTNIGVTVGFADSLTEWAAAVGGAVNVNEIKGTTGAYVLDSSINENTAAIGDVSISAFDATDITDVAANVSVAGSDKVSIGVGAAVSKVTLGRTIEAELGSSTTSKKTVNSKKLGVTAGNKNKVKAVTVGIAGGFGMLGAGGDGALVDMLESKNTVNASIRNITGTNTGLALAAAHDDDLDYLGIGVYGAGGEWGAGSVGVAYGLIDEHNNVNTALQNSVLTHTVDGAVDSIAATNHSKQNAKLGAVQLAIAYFSGAVGISPMIMNVEDSVALKVENSTLGSQDKRAESIALKADSYYDMDKFALDINGGSLAAVGVLTNYITLDSGNLLQVANSNLYGDSITISNRNFHDVDTGGYSVEIGGAAVDVNHTKVTIGGVVGDYYSTSNAKDDEYNSIDDQYKADSKDELGKAALYSHKLLGSFEEKLQGMTLNNYTVSPEGKFIVVDTKPVGEIKLDEENLTPTGTEAALGVETLLEKSNLEGKAINISSKTEDKVDIYTGDGYVGGLGVTVNAVRMDENVKNSLTIQGGSIKADNVTLKSDVTGKSYAHAAQGGFEAAGANVAYATVKANGNNSIYVDGTSITTKEGLLIRALDDATYETFVQGGGFNGTGGGYMEAESEDAVNNTITIQGAVMLNEGNNAQGVTNVTDTGADKASLGAMEVVAVKDTSAKAKIRYGTVIGIGGYGNSIIATVGSKDDKNKKARNEISLLNNTIKDVTYQGFSEDQDAESKGILTLYSLYNAKAETETDYGSGGILGGGGGTYSHAHSQGTSIILSQNNNYDLSKLQAESLVGKKVNNEAAVLAKNKTFALNIDLLVAGACNTADATIRTTAEASSINDSFATKEEKKLIGYEQVEKKSSEGEIIHEEVPVYAVNEVGKTIVGLQANSMAEADSSVQGITPGLGVSVGRNVAKSTVEQNTFVTLAHLGDEAVKLQSLTVDANALNKLSTLADGRGGAIFGISPYAAEAENNITFNTITKLEGKFDIQEQAVLTASSAHDGHLLSTTKNGGVISVAGNDAKNTVVGNTQVVLENAKLNAESVNLIAHNDINFNVKDNKMVFGIEGGSGGVVDVGNDDFISDIGLIADVDIKNSNVTTTDDIWVEAATDGAVSVKAYHENVGVGLGGGLFIDVKGTLDYKDTINVDANSTLKTTNARGNITLDAADDMRQQTNSYANNFLSLAILEIASSSTTNETSRTNSINVEGAIMGSNEVNLFAGKFNDLRISDLEVDVESISYAGFSIPFSCTTLTDIITDTNTVTIGSGVSHKANVTSVGNLNIFADDEALGLYERNIHSNWLNYKDDKNFSYVVTGNGPVNNGFENVNVYNSVNINGTVVAGVNHSLVLDIGAKEELVILDEKEREIFKKQYPELTINALPSLTYAEGSSKLEEGDIRYYKGNVGFDLTKRYRELQQALTEYSTAGTDTKEDLAYTSLVEAFEQVKQQLRTLGLLRLEPGGEDGSDKVEVLVENEQTYVMELPDISVSGGDVNITTRDLKSSRHMGAISAYGTPEVKINNNTNLYLVLNDIDVGGAGGRIVYNKTALPAKASTDDLNKEIGKINRYEKGGVDFRELHTESGAAGTIDLEGLYSGAEYEIAVVDENGNILKDEKGNTLHSTYRPDASIELKDGKHIVNKSGSITIRSANNNVLINGNIDGTDVHISADKGAVVQNLGQGVHDIGGSVQKQYEEILKKLRGSENDSGSVDYLIRGVDKEHYYKDATLISGDLDKPKDISPSAGTIAGSNIYISGEAININGLIQSGYVKYVVNITDQERIDEINNNWAGNALSDAAVKNSKYCVSEGKNIFDDATGYYYYQPAAYYNPSTGCIVVDNVEAYAGNITLSGQIVSTGNGRIAAMDGLYDITVNNTTNATLQLGDLIPTNVKGTVYIDDKLLNTTTLITKDGIKVIKGSGTPVTPVGEGSYSYQPKEGVLYSWNLGSDSSRRQFYEHEYQGEYWFGDIKAMDVPKEIEGRRIVKVIDNEATQKGPISYIDIKETELADTLQADHLKLFGSNTLLKETTSEVEEKNWKTGYLGYYRHRLFKWSVDTGTTQNYKASVNASQPIKIDFLSGNGNVDINSLGSVTLAGTVGNEALLDNTSPSATTGRVNITSTQGDIVRKNGQLVSNNITLSAAGSMENINIHAGNTLNLTAVNTGKDNQSYYRNGKETTDYNGNSMDFHITTASSTSTEGTSYGTTNLLGTIGNKDRSMVKNITLEANGDIVQSGAGAIVQAERVELISNNGNIGTAQAALNVDTGDKFIALDSMSASLNAEAKKNIYLNETEGDTRVGTILSQEGDVFLSGKGSLVDALPYEELQGRVKTEDELIELWTSIGLLEEHTYYDKEGNVHVQEAWDIDKLLYPISDKIINPTSGVATSTKAPNVKGHNITIKMGANAGNSDGKAEIYAPETIVNDKELREQISNADASTVQWYTIPVYVDAEGNVAKEKPVDEGYTYYKDGAVIIRKKFPIGVEMTENQAGEKGKLNIIAGYGDNESVITPEATTYVEGRVVDPKLTTEMDIAVEQIKTTGDAMVRNAHGDIINVNEDSSKAAIIAKNLEIDAGGVGTDGSVGKPDKYMNIDISGSLKATGRTGVYINQIGDSDLALENISSGGDIYLQALNSIYSNNDINDRGYLRLENGGQLSLVSLEGNVGLPSSETVPLDKYAIRVRNAASVDTNDSIVNISAKENINVYGYQYDTISPDPSGVLYLNEVATENGWINLISNGSIYINPDKVTNSSLLNMTAAQDVTVENILDGGYGDVELRNAKITAGLLNGTLYGGDIEIYGNNISLLEDPSLLGGESALVAFKQENEFGSQGTKGNITVSGTGVVTNQVMLNAMSGGIAVQGAEGVENSGMMAADKGGISIASENGPIYNNGDAFLVTMNGDIVLEAKQYIYNEGDVSSINGDIRMHSYDGNVYNYDDFATVPVYNESTGKYEESSKYNGEDIVINNIYLAAENGGVYNTKDLVAGSVGIFAKDSLDNYAYNIITENDIMLYTSEGDINNSAVLQSANGNINLIAKKGGIANLRQGYATEDVTNDNGGDIIALNGKVILEAGGDGSDTVEVEGQTYRSGSIVNNGDIISMGEQGEIRFTSAAGDIYNADTFSELSDSKGEAMGLDADFVTWYTPLAGSSAVDQVQVSTWDINLQAAKGEIYTAKDLVSEEGNVTLVSKNALDSVGQSIYAKKNVTLQATEGDLVNTAVLESMEGNISLISDKGSVINLQGADIRTLGGNVSLTAQGQGTISTSGGDSINAVTCITSDGTRGYLSVDAAGQAALTKDADKAADVADFHETRYYYDDVQAQWILVTPDINVPEGAQTKSLVTYTVSDREYELEVMGISANSDSAVYRNGSIVNYGDIISLKDNAQTPDAAGNIILTSKHGDVSNFDDLNKNGNDITYLESQRGFEQYGKSYAVAAENITLSAPEGEIYNAKKTLAAQGDISLTAAKNMESMGDSIYAGGSIDLTMTEGNLINKAALVADGGDVNVIAAKGTVVNMLSGDIIATNGSVNIHAGGNADADQQVYYVDTNGTVKKLEGVPNDRVVVVDKYYYADGDTSTPVLISDKVNVSALSNTEQSSIYSVVSYIDGDGNKVAFTVIEPTTTTSGNVEVFRSGDLVNRGDIVALGTTKQNEDGSYSTDVPGTVSLISDHGNVTNYDNFEMVDGADSYVVEGTKHFNEGSRMYKDKKYILGTGNIDLEAPEGYLYNNFDISTPGDLTIISGKDLVLGTNVPIAEVGGNLLAQSTGGKVINKDESMEIGKSTTLDGYAGVDSSGTINSGDDVILVSENGAVKSTDDITSEKGNVTLDGNKGVYQGGDISAAQDINVEAKNGDINIVDSTLVSGENIDLYTEEGNINVIDSALTADENVNINTAKGDITNEGSPIEAGKNVSVTTGEGNVSNSDSAITTGENVIISSDNGNVANTNSAITAGENVSINTAKGDITNEGSPIEAGNNVSVTTGQGDISNIDSAIKAEQNVNVIAEQGSITNDSNLTGAQGDVLLDAAKGVTSTGDINSGNNVSIYSDSQGINLGESNINAAEMARIWSDNGDIQGAANLQSLNGSVDVGATYGLINLGEVLAKDMAAVGSNSGDVTIGSIQGRDVILKSADGAVKVGKAVLDEYLVLQAKKAEIAKTERTDPEKLLNALVNVDELSDLGLSGKTRFIMLKTQRATNIDVGNHDLLIDNLVVGKEAHLTAYGYKTSVYGAAPKQDGSDAIYFDFGRGQGQDVDLELDKLLLGRDDKQPIVASTRKNLERIAASDPGSATGTGWMNLYITGPNYQRSNGALLHTSRYHYVDAQRYSMEDDMRMGLDFKADEYYDLHHLGPINYYSRYDLWENEGAAVVDGNDAIRLENETGSVKDAKDKADK